MSVTKPLVVLSDRIYVDKRLVKPNQIRSRYKIQMYDEMACSKCSNFVNRHNELCDVCPAFGGIYNLHQTFQKNGRTYWSLPIGDIQHVRNDLIPQNADFEIRKGYVKTPFTHKLKWTGSLYTSQDKDSEGNPRPNQVELVDKWMAKKNGIIRARPRSGKTVVAVNIIVKLGQKAIILCDRIELLRQFRATFVGNPRKGRVAMTNARKLEKKHGWGSVVKIVRKLKDLDSNPDIILMTYQSFLHDMTRIEKYINGKYATICVDEVHGVGADAFSKVVARLTMPYRLALTATTDRKDGREILPARLIGPVVATSKTHSLVPRIRPIVTSIAPPNDYKSWHSCLKWAANSSERNIAIMKEIFKDLRAGHKSIIVPLFWRDHQSALCDLINAQAKYLRKHKKEKWPIDLAVPLHSKVNRQATLNRVDNGEPCVLVAINSMIKQGVDMSTPTKLHLIIPTSAKAEVGAPMFRQLSYRVCTPMPGKREPEVAIWVDHLSMFKGCITGLFWNEIVPGLKKNNYLYRVDDMDFKVFSSLKTSRGGARASFASGWAA